jgi:hypothetical protein
MLPPTTQLSLGYELDGEIKTSPLALSRETLSLCGGIGFRQNTWQDCRSIAICTAAEAEKIPLQVFPELTETGYLFEGAAWVGQFHKDRRSRPYGWGGKLYLHRRLYNLTDAGDRIELVHEVTDPGEIKSTRWDSGKLTLTLQRIQELDTELHRLTAWLPDHSIQTIPAQQESHWSAPPLAVVLSYDGQRIGTWWADNWEESLESLTLAETGEVAAFLRWAQLPLLRRNAKSALGQLLDRLPGHVLRAWLLDEFLPDDLQISDTEAGWREVVGTLLHAWNLTPHISRLLKQLGGGSSDPWIVADRLRTISPIVAARFLKVACPNRQPQSLHADWGIASESELLGHIEQLKGDGLGIDTGMIEHRSLGLRMLARQWRDKPESLGNHQRMNLITATFTLQPFCDLLTLDILEGRL